MGLAQGNLEQYATNEIACMVTSLKWGIKCLNKLSTVYEALSEEEEMRFVQEVFDAEQNANREKDTFVEIALPVLLKYFKRHGIVSTHYSCTGDDRERVEEVITMGEYVSPDSDAGMELPFPRLLVAEKGESLRMHVAFMPNKVESDIMMRMEFGEIDTIVLICLLGKS